MSEEQFAFDPEVTAERASGEPALIVDVEGFEGPLDLLLILARQQKVDLAKISILALADQYLAFIEAARQVRMELAADYLVMAAWLAYLKSRLLLPEAAEGPGPSAEDLATQLAFRLRRLEAFRAAAEQLITRPQLNREVFARGAPEPIRDIKHPEWTATLYDLLSAYAAQRQKHALARALCPAHRLVARRRARGNRTVDRDGKRMEPPRRVSHRLCGGTLAARDRAGIELRGDARTRARGACRNASAGCVHADLFAQARGERRRAFRGGAGMKGRLSQ